jgi:putative multiple sugar transport system ATP-binding protein
MDNITKQFPGVLALQNVSLNIKRGEIHALVGENGAGKSTLMNILGGIYPYGTYSGRIIFEGVERKFHDVRDSEKVGISIIHQELALSPYLSIGENIFLGNERAHNNVIDWDRTYREAKTLLDLVGLKENPHVLVKDIGVGKQQLVEIAKALSRQVKLLVLDEPTASLNEGDSEHLLHLLLDLKKQGITSILISHKLNEIVEVADSITVLRDGRVIETIEKGRDEIDEDRIIKGMVGRELVDRFPKRIPRIGDVALEVRDWNVHNPSNLEQQVIRNVSFKVHKGEIVGIAGLMGAGRTELAMSIFGKSYGARVRGTLIKDGKEIHINNVRQAIQHGLAYATEDRKNAGLNLIGNLKENISIAGLDKISRGLIINNEKEINVAESYRRRLDIHSLNIFQKVGDLSGGNQQKVVLSKWIFAEPDVLFLDEPTRGIDVGAKFEIYSIINELANDGKAIVFISSELPEILGISDRIYVMSEGRIVGEFLGSNATQEKIMKCIMESMGRANHGK